MSRYVLKSDFAEKKVFEFVPPKFELATSQEAQQYLEVKNHGDDFRMSDVIRIQTGIKEIETADFQSQIEEKALEKIKEVQEAAYKEAYSLGLQEGRHEAFQKSTAHIDESLQKLNDLIATISHMKTEIFKYNESHIVQLAFHMASRLANGEITAKPELIKDILKNSLEVAQDEENVTVQVAPAQIEFLEKLKSETGRELDFLKHIHLEANEEISLGGCIIETNYGEIDARFEQRVQKLWETISENLYRVKDTIRAD